MRFDIAARIPDARLREYRTNEARKECERRIFAAGWPIYKQINSLRAGGDGGGPVIDALRARSNALESLIATLTVPELRALDVRDPGLWA